MKDCLLKNYDVYVKLDCSTLTTSLIDRKPLLLGQTLTKTWGSFTGNARALHSWPCVQRRPTLQRHWPIYLVRYKCSSPTLRDLMISSPPSLRVWLWSSEWRPSTGSCFACILWYSRMASAKIILVKILMDLILTKGDVL